METFECEMLDDTEEVAKLAGSGAEGEAKDLGDGDSSLTLGNELDAAIGSPLQLLQDKVVNGSQSAVLPKMLGVLRSLNSLPDDEVGLTAWHQIEKITDAISSSVLKVNNPNPNLNLCPQGDFG